MINDDILSKQKKRIIWTRYPIIFLTVLFCCTLWGSATPAIKTAYKLFQISGDNTASRILLAGVRFTLSGVMTISFGSLIERRFLLPKKSSLRNICVLALFQTVGQYYFYFMALAHISGVRSSIINASGNFLAIIFAALIFRLEKMTWRKILGCFFGFAGVILILGGFRAFHEAGAVTFEGEGALLTADVFYALASCCIKIMSKDENPVVLSGWQFFLGGIILSVIGVMMGGKLIFYGKACYIDLIYMGFISAGAFTLWGVLLTHNPVSRIAILGFLNPVMSVLLSGIILGENKEVFSWKGLFALGFVSLGIIVVNSGERHCRS